MKDAEFRELLDGCRPWLRARVAKATTNRCVGAVDASDLTNIAVLRAWESRGWLSTLDAPQVGRWLITTVRHLVIDRWRKRIAQSEGPLTGIEQQHCGGPSVLELMVRDEQIERAQRFLRDLSDLQRQVVKLRFEDVKHDDIAHRLGITPEYSAKLFERAIKRLRTRLAADI